MRERSCAEVDVPAVHGVADRLRVAAELIDDAVEEHLARLAFSGAGAGRPFAARGDALRAGLQRLAAELSQWSRASVAVAVALRASADRYADAELCAARRIA
ncbi:type VII secretion target [Mycobacterium sp. Lab-001]|uniref:type VII secretion target n=1 Tax=Mycobacterium sp. Lab-001 TaxID=3410136 RepID=UPI003D164E6D